MRDDPVEIADHLEGEHGLHEALAVVDDGKRVASTVHDYYALSVWREVRVILRDRAGGSPDQPK